MKADIIQATFEVYQDSQLIFSRGTGLLSLQEWMNRNPHLELELSTVYKDGQRINQVVNSTIGNKSGKYAGILTTTYVDLAAMEEKTNEIEALLQEYGAQLNGSKTKYDAHILSLSEKQFTVQKNQPVEIFVKIFKYDKIKTK